MGLLKKSSKKPSKQRKRLYEAPLHRRGKIMSVNLSPDLRQEHGVRSLPVRVGDRVRVMRGDAKGMEGKVTRVDRKRYRVHVEGLTRKKQSGDTVPMSIHYSNLMIIDLDLSDSYRKEKLEILSAREG